MKFSHFEEYIRANKGHIRGRPMNATAGRAKISQTHMKKMRRMIE
jgi:hypothetical protein